ncbi:MAG: limonene-1,2-epoxide hydrolase family protein [Pseudomonadota bacterium]
MTKNEEIIRGFISAWSRLDAEELVKYFSEDGIYHNMPASPVSGHDNLKSFISAFLKNWTSTEWDVLNLVSKGDIVIAERLDRTRVGEKGVNLPCCGVFEMENGKIKIWRDYFDMATFSNALKD